VKHNIYDIMTYSIYRIPLNDLYEGCV